MTDTQALLYIASYGDLIQAYGANPEAGRTHYANVGQSQGRTIRFEAERYVASYADLIAAFGGDVDAAARHYILAGYREGRQASFDSERYIASYPDLIRTFGADTAGASRHYITKGYAEGRKADFDAIRYIASYPDLARAFGTDTVQATHHYIVAGYREGRTVGFDAFRYIATYRDLIVAFGTDVQAATRHFITKGLSEGRAALFNAAQYLANYADLAAASKHFIVVGLSEGRTDAVPTLSPAPPPTPPAPSGVVLTIRARGTLNAGVGPMMVVRVNGAVVGSTTVQSTVPADYSFALSELSPGAKVDVAFTNDANSNGQDRNLFISYLTDGRVTVFPTAPGSVLDKGSADKAFDGLDVAPGTGDLTSNSALRLTWPGASVADANAARKYAAARLLQQATFGPTPGELDRLVTMTDAAWVNEQIAMPVTPDFVTFVQKQYDQGAAYRPGGASYDSISPVRYFWSAAATGQDQLRKRVMLALQEIIVASQADSNLYSHTRAYANYLDTLNKHAFGNYRNLIEDIALSPVMGIYLSHMRNRKEDPATGRLPDENFAREVMQLFTIGLVELNQDGTPTLGANGQPVETYNNADVMAMAKVFTGWSWGFPDAQLTDSNFRNGNPNYAVASDTLIDLQRMKAYPNQHSTSEKRLFAGKPSAVVIPANTAAADSLRIALDTLFNHPNVGPFIGKQLIQRLVTSNPSPAYVSRVAGAFNNNGQGVRGDMAAVVRAVLLDAEARQAPTGNFGKLREPILRATAWMRAFGATSTTGNYLMAYDLDSLTQRPFNEPSVFSYFRPGYIPPNSALADASAPAPEFQLVNETTTPIWINLAETMAGSGLGWTGSARDVVPNLVTLTALSTNGNVDALIENLNQLLFAGRMPPALRADILDAVAGVTGTTDASHLSRVRVAIFMALASPEFLIQR